MTELNEEDTVCEDFTVMYKGERVCRVSLRVPGEHNMMMINLSSPQTLAQAIAKVIQAIPPAHR